MRRASRGSTCSRSPPARARSAASTSHSPGSRTRFADHRLDRDRDDYYGRSGTWWDAQDSLWLARAAAPDRRLTVELAGALGGEAVTSGLPGIDCPAVCEVVWAGGDAVELTAAVGARTRFLRWEGDCAGRGDCTVTIDADRRVRAVFGPASHRVRLTVTGRGAIASADAAACRRRCAVQVDAGARVAFRVRPDRGWRLARWTGACAPARSRPRCTVRATRPLAIGAVFRRA